MRFTDMFLTLLSAVPAVAQTSPTAPGLTYLYNCNISVGLPVRLGPIPDQGNRTIYPFIGGQLVGPNFSGKILAIGGDWGLIDTRGYYYPDMRAQLETPDQAYISIRTTGWTNADGSIHVRTSYETGSPSYMWLNDVVGLGIMRTTNTGFELDMWQF